MSRSTLSVSVGILVYLITASAHADRNAPTTAARADAHFEYHGDAPTAFADFERLQRGKLHFDFGAIDYRLAREGLTLTTRIGGAATRALIGPGGEHRLEVGWQLRGASVTLAFAEQDHRSGYRIELTREF